MPVDTIQEKPRDVGVIAKVEAAKDDGWFVKNSDGFNIYVPNKGVEPHEGDEIALYGKGFGFKVRGMAINGRVIYYEDEEADGLTEAIRQRQEDIKNIQRYMDNRKALQERINALPDLFQRRIQRFREGNKDFNWQYLEYEMFCCEDAVKIANAFTSSEEIRVFGMLSWKEQQEQIPDLFNGHSENSWGCAINLAMLYRSDAPEDIVGQHGAMTPLVGCKAYGCTH